LHEPINEYFIYAPGSSSVRSCYSRRGWLLLKKIINLASAAAQGLKIADAQFWRWVGAETHAPLLNPWRIYIREAAVFRLSQFPLYFMLFVMETCLLAEAYRRLLPAQKPGIFVPQYPGPV